MKTKKSLTLLAAAALLLAPLPRAYSADSDIGMDGAAFMKIPTGSPRVQALGNNGVSLVEGGEAMNVNPAGIASAQMREASFSYLSWIQDYSGQYMSYVHPIGQSVIGVNLAYYGIKDFDVRDTEGKPQYGADVKVRNGYASISIAKGFFLEKFLVGVSAKEVLEDNYTTEYKNLVFDMGAVLRLGRKLSLGWAAQNMSGKKHQVVKVNRLGGAFAFNPFVTLALEQKSYSDRKGRLGGGVELNLPEELLQVGRVALRAGYSPSDSMGKNMTDKTLDSFGLNDVSGWSFGVGLYSAQALGYGIGFDYTLAPYGALGKASQMALRFQF
ncbi:MAG TPA: hypothetical protein DCW72_11085 [Elusimicrobia bacterium]|nr:MAG: hypothetical protein A2X29_04105 [Elusimicrobia bacterium GWA2_64_40]OGR64707.1 MAG: hypothetical protein A2X30_05140 [Elusimicrobia bacterium GWB2_63_16]HAU90720.1 hypothetical protein [Elusimicrobiota bacterium]